MSIYDLIANPAQVHLPTPQEQASLQDLITQGKLRGVQYQQAQRENQNQVSLQDLFRKNPGFINQQTGMPSPEGLAGVYGIDPMTGMKLSQLSQTGELQRGQINAQGLTNQVHQQELDKYKKDNLTKAHMNETNAFVSAHRLSEQRGSSPQQAQADADKAWSMQLDQDKADKLLEGITPEMEAEVRARPRNIKEMEALSTTPQQVISNQEKKLADDRANEAGIRAMKTPLEKAQDRRTQLEEDGKKGSREWKDNQALIAKETAPTTMMMMQNSPIPDDVARLLAEQRVAGDTSATVGLARNPMALAAVLKQVGEIAKERNLKGTDLANFNAEFMGSKAGERTLGVRTANIEMAVQEAQNVLPIALAASEKVDRTKYPNLNAILMSAQKGTGDENVVKFASATNALINIYSRAIAPSGVPTISDKDHAREIISAAYSKGQFAAVTDIMQQEMAAARKSPGQVKSSMREAMTAEPEVKGKGKPVSPYDPDNMPPDMSAIDAEIARRKALRK